MSKGGLLKWQYQRENNLTLVQTREDQTIQSLQLQQWLSAQAEQTRCVRLYSPHFEHLTIVGAVSLELFDLLRRVRE